MSPPAGIGVYAANYVNTRSLLVVRPSLHRSLTMNASAFDRLSQTLATVGSRRAAVGALITTAGAALGLAGAHDAEASRKRCRRKGGQPANGGNCQCGWQCEPSQDQFHCHGNANCVCYKDASGRGFCGEGTGNGFCTKNSECTSPRKCVVNTCAGGLCILPCTT